MVSHDWTHSVTIISSWRFLRTGNGIVGPFPVYLNNINRLGTFLSAMRKLVQLLHCVDAPTLTNFHALTLNVVFSSWTKQIILTFWKLSISFQNKNWLLANPSISTNSSNAIVYVWFTFISTISPVPVGFL